MTATRPSSVSTDAGHLPIADGPTTRRAALALIHSDPRAFTLMLALSALATTAGLAGPYLLGRIVNEVGAGSAIARIDRTAAAIVAFAVLQLILTRYARLVSERFGERAAAYIRETFLDRVLALPARIVEKSSLGDLAARANGDVATVSTTMRYAAPDVVIAVIQALLILVGVFVANPLLGLCALVGLPGTWLATRWYLQRARTAYLAAGAANSMLAEVLATTAAGARTVEALGLQEQRLLANSAAIERACETRLVALRLRTVLFPSVDISFVLPLVAVLLVGGLLYNNGSVSLGSVVACALYLRQLSGPIDTFELWVDQLQSCGASFARLEGITELTAPPEDISRVPRDDRIVLRGVHYAYDGRDDVLNGIDLDIEPGERLAVVGASGAGKSTLARLIAGIDKPRTGSVTVGGVAVSELPVSELRHQIVLVTQEHHVFRGTIRDNLIIARSDAIDDDQLRAALTAVGADWFAALPDGLETELGSEVRTLDAGQAQQVALARVVLADPHTLILDEATAMLDPTTARRTERALSAVLAGRTVLAIAHRLHTVHDADRVAVIDQGRLLDIGTHDDLVARGGTYSDLWAAWHGNGTAP
jgi:ABC-type multidrug transport system fused ATPase/permease subunit